MKTALENLLNDWKQEALQLKNGNVGWGIERDINDYKFERLEECIKDLEKLLSQRLTN